MKALHQHAENYMYVTWCGHDIKWSLHFQSRSRVLSSPGQCQSTSHPMAFGEPLCHFCMACQQKVYRMGRWWLGSCV